jgi:long-chain fatty acid transport protein
VPARGRPAVRRRPRRRRRRLRALRPERAVQERFQEQRQLSIGSSVFTLSTDFTGDDPYPGAGREEFLDIAVPVPVGYYVHPVSDRAVLGIGVFAPFGLKTEWNDPDFSGRFISRVAKLDAIAVNPTIAYRFSDRLSIGGGVDVRVTSVQLERDVPFPNPFTGALMYVASVKLESDTAVDVGFNLGVLVKPGGGFSLGAAYRHRVNVDFTGEADFTPRPTGSASSPSPTTARSSGSPPPRSSRPPDG